MRRRKSVANLRRIYVHRKSVAKSALVPINSLSVNCKIDKKYQPFINQMTSEHEVYVLRRWMYNRRDPETGEVSREFRDGLRSFINQAANNPYTPNDGNIFCPCVKCGNTKYLNIDMVKRHVYNRGFTPNYYVWFSHGEGYSLGGGSSSTAGGNDQPRYSENFNNDRNMFESYEHLEGNRFHDMVTDAYHGCNPVDCENMTEEPNAEAKKFYDMLDAANEPIYEGCTEGLSKLSLASLLISIKSEGNIAERSMNQLADAFKQYLPQDNNSAGSYYEMQKLVAGLGLPSEKIDVCIDNCMIFWQNDEKLQECRFCGKPRYRATKGRTRVPYKRMWYLPITDRLKRLYQSERTSAAMRWHAEHTTNEGEVNHPSDAKAWKHFNTVHSEFAKECRNVYLGLCTDGFSPFGLSGRQYSLWPIILTPYNLPPDMCMKSEFLFMTILVPGPSHPKRSLDVFLQPLIHELKQLWWNGVWTFDHSQQQNFKMRAVLLWTISDFPAYGMLSGWTTHGRLSCPYCMGWSDAFQLKHGKKSCWFDCHRRYLSLHHPYRRNKKLFRKNKIVRIPPSATMSGNDLLEQIDYYGAQETCKRGGNWHTAANMPDEYGVSHNWHKKSIFWELPYWKDHLLRHNLDPMHIVKNFFDNIMNTILNVPGKSKDNMKSRLDLAEICARSELHITSDGKQPIPYYRLSGEARQALFNWISTEVKFPDGYVSKFSRCIEQGKKISGMKSHDCHVFMQRLLPFALLELLPTSVHEAIAGIGAFFRDLCTRTLTEDGITQLNANIPLLLCNMEKIFPPSFFDVMEHLPIHLPREAALGGPVQYRWMYPFERFMGHLKRKVKNQARVEGSIVAGSLTEETSHFTSYYFAPNIKTKRTQVGRYDDGGVAPSYGVSVPDIFTQIGRFGGKINENYWENHTYCRAAHNYILRNCEDILPFESEFDREIREAFPNLGETDYATYKDRDFAGWLKYYVRNGCAGRPLPVWLHEIVEEPLGSIVTAPMYFTRGYTFHTYEHGSTLATANYGIHVPGEIEFYGILNKIIEVTYPGALGLRCILFQCNWFNTTPGRGVRTNHLGVTDVNATQTYSKFDPFILACQAEQVCFIPYPHTRKRRDTWLSVIKVNPRGRIVGEDTDVVMQQDRSAMVPTVTESTEYIVHARQEVEDIVVDNSENKQDECDEFETTDEDDETDESASGTNSE